MKSLPRSRWSLSRKLIRNRSVSIPSLNMDYGIISGDIDKAENEYICYIIIIMEYADVVWSGRNSTDLDKLEGRCPSSDGNET